MCKKIAPAEFQIPIFDHCVKLIILYNRIMNPKLNTLLEKIEKALSEAILYDYDAKWQKASFGALPDAITQNKTFITKLLEPNIDLIKLGGKRWRPLFLMLCYQMAKKQVQEQGLEASPLSEKAALSLTPLVEFVHTASLIHDDIEDSADLRRGKPAAHITYGIDHALNSASWLYFEAPVCLETAKLTDAQKLAFYKLYTNELRRLHLGQAMDIYWHKEKDVYPAIEEYLAMVQNKTGTLASLAAQVGFMAGGATEKQAATYGKTAAQIGVGFQIIDDVINLTKGNPGKKRGDDIVEGKKSLPVLLHIQQFPGDKAKISKLMTQAAKEGITSPAVEKCIALLEKSGCIQTAAEKGKMLIQTNCAKFAANPFIPELFNAMIPKDLF